MKKIFSLFVALMAVLAINATDYYIVGSGSQGWSQNKAENKFVANASGVLTVTVDQLYGDVKVTEDGNWHPQWGKTGDANLVLGTPYTLTKCDDSQGEADAVNLPVELPEGMRYKNAVLTLDVTNPNAIVLTLVSAELYDPSAAPTVYCLVGGCTNNWDPASAVEFAEVNGVLTANVPDLNGTFKIIKNHEWGWELAAPAGTKIDGNNPFTLSVGGENIGFANPFAGYLNAVLTLDMSNAEAPVLTLVGGTFNVFQADWFIPGGKLGWECKDAQKMTKLDDTHYEYLAAEFNGNFKAVYGSNWEVEFGGPKGGETLNWTVNTPIALSTPAADVIAADETVYTDVTITLTVNYETAEVSILLATGGTAVENVAVEGNAAKRLVNGQIVIEKDGVRYNVLGAVVK
ncbi:MAG: hypothetical protein MJZ89_00665 [Paludibacteraceae bacterium]|nr:hypothetical protein [Paludibacteraceae bacterium]